MGFKRCVGLKMSANIITYPLFYIEWEDSQLGFQGWKFIEEQPKKTPSVVSVGFLIHKDDKCRILYPHLQMDNESGSGDILIPASCIIREVELSVPS